MAKRKVKKQIKVESKNANIVLLLFVVIFLLLLYRAGILSLSKEVDGINLDTFAASRTTQHDTILAKRGTIYDINGEALAQNVYSYTLIAYLSPSRGEGNYVKDKEYTAEQLSTVIDLSKERILELLNSTNSKGDPLYQTEFGNKGKGLTEITKDKIKSLNLDGIDFIESQKRYYPKGDFLSYTLGYAKSDENGKITGELGIESLYNDSLTGTDGYKEYQKDLRGYKIANTPEIIQDATDGNNIYLTVDSNVQFFLEQALENASDKYNFDQLNIIVAEAKTGRILGLSTAPSFDPNLRNITNYMDPNISIPFEPGSTMKIYTYMCVMENGNYNGEETFLSGVYKTKDGTEIGDSNRNGWGVINFDRGFALSSNVGIINLIDRKINGDLLKDYFKKLGFGSKTGIELSKESSGKLDFKYETEVYNAGFGQGIMVTGIQNIKALTSVANNGILLEPYIVDRVEDANGNVILKNERKEIERVASKETTDKIKDLMEQVVLSGTGSGYKMDGYNLIAKTGTAQISSTNGRGYLTGPNDVIRGFAGMFPKDDPQIIIYANLHRPNPNSPSPLISVIKEVVTNVSKYYNIYDEEQVNEIDIKYDLTSYLNKDVEEVKELLISKGITPIIIGDGNRIIDQYPNQFITITSGNKVFLKTNSNKITLENMIGWSKKDVTAYLKLINTPCAETGTGYLVEQSIPAGTEITEGLALELTFNPKYEEELNKKEPENTTELEKTE